VKAKSRFFLYFFVLFVATAGYLQNRYDRHTNYFSAKNVFVSLPSGKSLRIFSFGFQNLLADFLYIWAIQLFSTYTIENRFDYIEPIFNTITDVTPAYRDPYMIGSLIMVYEKKDPLMAIRLLDKGSAAIPGEWIFDHDAGYYAYKFLKDYPKAEFYYSRAAQKPGAPAFIQRNKAHMVYLEDNLAVAWRMWQEIYRNARERIERDSAFNHLFQIKSDVDSALLQQKIKQFRQAFGRNPIALEELVHRRFIREIPHDFSGKEYLYDPKSGQVRARQVFRWKKFS
jgi:hypothetical protein